MILTFEEFKELLYKWNRDNAGLSVERGDHPNCAKILMAENNHDIISFASLLLGDERLCHQLLRLFYQMVNDPPPINPYYRGRIPVLIECYKYWALDKKYVEIHYDPNSYWVEDKYDNKGDWH